VLKNKYTFILTIALSLIVLGGGVLRTQAQADQGERIISFSSNLETRTDAGMKVTETIVYDFGKLERHGIFRIIRDQNANGKKMSIKGIDVTDEKGQSYNYVTTDNADDVTVKIGNPDATITGVHTYIIVYDVSNVATYFDDKDEFTWNVMGDKWNIPILKASATVQLPENVATKNVTLSCYKGKYGSTEQCTDKKIENGSIYFSDSNFAPSEDLTISIGLPKGIIVSGKEPFDYSFLAWILPIVVGAWFIFRFMQKKKELGANQTIIVEYEQPQGMTPTLVGSVVDGRVNNLDITAGLISVAEKGFVKIKRIEKKWLLGNADFELTLLRPITELSDLTEQKILEYFFTKKTLNDTVVLSELGKTDFPLLIAGLKDKVYSEIVEKGFFSKNPKTRKQAFGFIGYLFVFAGIFPGIALGIHAVLALASSGILLILYPYIVVARTKKGVEARRHILGFKQFLSVTDKERFDFHNAPEKMTEKNPEQFMKFLPFAIALGVEEKWAKQFEGIYLTPPAWYSGASAGQFTAGAFVHDMSSFTAYSNSISSPHSSGGASGGGGFSGGGGGGGGGGSW
jgi:uncharacterized membrane protein